MIRPYRYLGAILLSITIATPLAIAKPAVAIQDHDDRDRDHDRDRRVYDPYHRDYHNWDEREDHAYREWLAERHYEYRDFNSLKRNQQKAYWNWRHEHEEHEEHEHH
jgi:uncharacterized protein YecT (DUF1311 family)